MGKSLSIIIDCRCTDLGIGCPDKLKLSQNVNECYLGLHQCKAHANTVPGAPAKWHVCQLRAVGLLFSCESEDVSNEQCHYKCIIEALAVIIMNTVGVGAAANCDGNIVCQLYILCAVKDFIMWAIPSWYITHPRHNYC